MYGQIHANLGRGLAGKKCYRAAYAKLLNHIHSKIRANLVRGLTGKKCYRVGCGSAQGLLVCFNHIHNMKYAEIIAQSVANSVGIDYYS